MRSYTYLCEKHKKQRYLGARTSLLFLNYNFAVYIPVRLFWLFLFCYIMSAWFIHDFFIAHFLQHGRSDSYRVATLPNIRDDNKTADGMYKVYSEMDLCFHTNSIWLTYLGYWDIRYASFLTSRWDVSSTLSSLFLLSFFYLSFSPFFFFHFSFSLALIFVIPSSLQWQ